MKEHGGNDYDIEYRAFAFERGISFRKALEAVWISSKNPAMNNLAMTSDLLRSASCEDDEWRQTVHGGNVQCDPFASR